MKDLQLGCDFGPQDRAGVPLDLDVDGKGLVDCDGTCVAASVHTVMRRPGVDLDQATVRLLPGLGGHNHDALFELLTTNMVFISVSVQVPLDVVLPRVANLMQLQDPKFNHFY